MLMPQTDSISRELKIVILELDPLVDIFEYHRYLKSDLI